VLKGKGRIEGRNKQAVQQQTPFSLGDGSFAQNGYVLQKEEINNTKRNNITS
jgi:hypothetical protein